MLIILRKIIIKAQNHISQILQDKLETHDLQEQIPNMYRGREREQKKRG